MSGKHETCMVLVLWSTLVAIAVWCSLMEKDIKDIETTIKAMQCDCQGGSTLQVTTSRPMP